MTAPKFVTDNLVDIPAPTPEAPKSHFERHPNDFRPEKGFSAVRVDGGDSKVKAEDRRYAFVRTGYGEASRVKSARKRGVGESIVLDTTDE